MHLCANRAIDMWEKERQQRQRQNVHLQFGIKQCDCFPFQNRRGISKEPECQGFQAALRSVPGPSWPHRGWERVGWFKEIWRELGLPTGQASSKPRALPHSFHSGTHPKRRGLTASVPALPFSTAPETHLHSVFLFCRALGTAMSQQ